MVYSKYKNALACSLALRVCGASADRWCADFRRVGRIKSGVKFSKARKEEMVLTYQQTIQQTFRGVPDSLTGHQKNREFRQHQEQLLVFGAGCGPPFGPLSRRDQRPGSVTTRILDVGRFNTCPVEAK
jgi:hypothetical protein